MSTLGNHHNAYPHGLKPGDFIQTVNHFGDVYFEVTDSIAPSSGSDYWSISYVQYGKYGSRPQRNWVNCSTEIRAVIPAEMAVPVMLQKRLRFNGVNGHFDPFHGYAPKGTALRRE